MSYLSARFSTLSSFSSIFNLVTLPITFPEIDVVWELRICVHLQHIKIMRSATHDIYCVGDLLHPFQRFGYICFYYLCFGSLFHWTMNGILAFSSAAAVIISLKKVSPSVDKEHTIRKTILFFRWCSLQR